jgi:cysteine desulfurase/selenocysteine lyase
MGVYSLSAASTPCLASVHRLVNQYLPFYSSVHRGTGFKSKISTHFFEKCRSAVLKFVGADETLNVAIFVKNTTDAINKLARRFPFTDERNVVLTTGMEHHADDLPWRAFAPKTVHVNITEDGQLDMQDLDAKLEEYKDKVALVAVTGASNVTGFINPIHDIAKKAHRVGAKIFVDCAQLVAHRKVDMKPENDDEHIDYLAFSAHKMYAPLGVGVLVGPKSVFDQGIPDIQGGGAVAYVSVQIKFITLGDLGFCNLGRFP